MPPAFAASGRLSDGSRLLNQERRAVYELERSVCVFVCVCVLTAGCSCSWEQGDPSGSVSIGQAHSPNDPGSSIANLEENYALIT